MISADILRDLAPTGTLRIAIMYTNPVLASGTPAGGDLRGIAFDLAHELARRVNLPMQIIGYETTAKKWVGLQAGAWDVAFTAYDPKHGGISFTAPYLESEGTYLVPPKSRLRSVADVDQEGVRIAVSAQSSLDKHLTRTLRHATLEGIPGAPAAAELLIAGKADALAGVRQQLMRVATRLAGSRILDGRFMAISQALAIPIGRDAGTQYLRAFVEDIKASGLVALTIEKNGITGVSVSPRAAPQ